MKLPKSIIKKYGISKKAWRVYKSRSRSTKKRKVVSMARRKKYYVKRGRRRVGSSLSLTNGALYSFGYGAVRNKVNDTIRGLTQNVALNFSDEVLLGIVNYFVAKKGSGMLKKLATVGLYNEAYELGRRGVPSVFGGNTTQENNAGSIF